jgi:ABC-type bacteriocin/lantibiotic exporter with double-glycine peptidase domain
MKAIFYRTVQILSSKERRQFAILILLDFVVSVLDIFFLGALLYIISFYTHTDENSINGVFYGICKDHPLLLITIFFALFTVKNFAVYLVFKRQYNFVYGVALRIAKDKLRQYLQGKYTNYVDTDSSVHIHQISQQPIEFSHYVLKGILQVFSQVVLLLITISAILLLNAQLFLLLLILLVPPVLLVGFILKKKLHAARVEAKHTSQKSLQHLQEALSGFVESKIYDKEKFFTNRYYKQQGNLNKHLSDQQIIQNIPARVIEVFSIFGLFVLVFVNAIRTDNSTLPFLTIGAFVAASYKIIPGIVKIINSIGQVKTYAYTCEDLAVKDPGKTKVDVETEAIRSFGIDRVSLKYKNVEVLQNISVQAIRGDFLGMSGASGKGKTTLLNVLLGFVSPNTGRVVINDGKQMPASLLWKNIAYVKQQPFLINDTIRANITFEENSYDYEKLLEVMAVTGIDQMLKTSTSGLDTVVAENGRNLSGGQRQRIALARALYKNFDLLVLDEPFSELDEESEMDIMRYLKQLAAIGKIVFLITHNRKALSFCNKTVSLDEYH